MLEQNNKKRKITSYWRIGFVFMLMAAMIFVIGKMAVSGSQSVVDGKLDLSVGLLDSTKTVSLNGQWEFYWNQLLTSADFEGNQTPQMDSFMKVPDTWSGKESKAGVYPNNGVATYRLCITYPITLKDPALRIQNVASAYKLYANGQLITEVGKLSDQLSVFEEGEASIILDLPENSQNLELIFQVGNLNFAQGGIRETPLFGSKAILEQNKMRLLAIQLFFIGSVFVFGVYYFLVFLLQTKNKTALLFSMICFITALRSLMWGAAPVEYLFPNATFNLRAYINYLTGYNYIPIIALFVLSLFPLVSKKSIWGFLLLPTLLFNMLFLTPPSYMSRFTGYLYIVILIQLVYMLYILIKAVLQKKQNAILMLITICIFFLTIIQDILYHRGFGGAYVPDMFLFGTFVVVMTMSYVQARNQANAYKRLTLYNEKLVEADQLKDKIMATEMSFLHAQIKPHFLYNALDAIANVCEKDGKRAGNLIIDLAVYLRGSLEFNNLDKMTTMEKELELVDTYFNIERARFGEKIQLLKVIESPLDFQLPVLVLQPLVENAVRHGISKKLGGGTITISIEEAVGATCIQIRDDGVGIGEKILERLLTNDQLDQGVGLLNIHHRLQRMYGSGLEISSEEGLGTCVKFIIEHARKSNGGKER